MSDALLAVEPALSAVARARRLGYAVAVADLGEWGPRVRPCAEVDLSWRRIVVDRRVLEAARSRLGEDGAARIAALAIDHELAHVADPALPEAAIRGRCDAVAGADGDALVRAVLT